jgi:hypothetical protein
MSCVSIMHQHVLAGIVFAATLTAIAIEAWPASKVWLLDGAAQGCFSWERVLWAMAQLCYIGM